MGFAVIVGTLLAATHLGAAVPAPIGAPWSLQAPAEALGEPLRDDAPAHLAISLRIPDRDGLARELADLQDRASPSYHRWLGPQQFGARFGLPVAKYERIASWLEAQGFTVTRSPNRIFIEGTGQARDVRRALGVQLHRVDDRGRAARSFSGTPRLPRDFAASVLIIDGLDTRLRLHHRLATSGGNFFGAADLQALYDVTPLLGAGAGGTGQSLAVLGTQVQNTPPSATDIAWYFQNISHASATYVPITLPNPSGSYETAAANEEYETDVELQSVGAPNAATINLVLSPADEVFSTGFNYVVTSLPNVAVVSMSLGTCEANAPLPVAQAAQQLVDEGLLAGIAWFASSGDSGSDDCAESQFGGCPSTGNSVAVDFPADMPEMVAVGGTEPTGNLNWNSLGNLTAYQEESVWSQFATNAGGGGQGTLFPKPAYQNGLGPSPSDGARDLPDLALVAEGVLADNAGTAGGLSDVGGTSVATPLAAGIFATLAGFCNQRLGDIHATLYSLGQAQAAGSGPAMFHDVTIGNNGDCGVAGFDAGPGYDLASGWGSIDAAALAAVWPGCDAGAVPEPGPTVPVGIACANNLPCNANAATDGQCEAAEVPGLDGGLQSSGWYGGYCTIACVALPDGGLAATGCPANSVCAPQPGGGPSLCLLGCAGFFAGACGRTDNVYNCEPLTEGTDAKGNPTYANFACRPGCKVDADCGAPGLEVCNAATGQCVATCAGDVDSSNASQCFSSGACTNPGAACGTAGAAVGSPCLQENDCPVGGFCLPVAGGYPGGYCTARECGANPAGVCGANAQCYIQDPTTNAGQCFAQCAQASDCRAGYGCAPGNPSPDGGVGPGICTPAPAIPDGGISGSSGSSSGGSSGNASGSSGGSPSTGGSGSGGTTGSSTGATTASSSGATTASSSVGTTASSSVGTTASSSGATAGSSAVGTTGSSTGTTTGSSTGATAWSSSGGTTGSSSGEMSGSSSGRGGGKRDAGPSADGGGESSGPASGGGSGCGCSAAAPTDLALWVGWLLALGLRRRRG